VKNINIKYIGLQNKIISKYFIEMMN
jgi:hypothetical protein